jgi:uncharacterized membrane protein YeaQ/YmgE (transglycosylase-associated protein family)
MKNTLHNTINNASEGFQYTYSAKQQEEIQKIRAKYIVQAEDKMEQLRRLDKSATKLGTIATLALGIVGTLITGIGMCCTLIWADKFFIPGIIIGIIGFVSVGSALPLYNHITKKQREKLAPEILRLTDELAQK